MIGTPEETGQSPRAWQQTVLHEHMHQFQDTHPAASYAAVQALDLHGGDETGMWMLNYPFAYDDPATAEAGRALADAALAALDAEPDGFDAAFDAYAAARAAFIARLSDADHRYYEFQVWKEGLRAGPSWRWPALRMTATRPHARRPGCARNCANCHCRTGSASPSMRWARPMPNCSNAGVLPGGKPISTTPSGSTPILSLPAPAEPAPAKTCVCQISRRGIRHPASRYSRHARRHSIRGARAHRNRGGNGWDCSGSMHSRPGTGIRHRHPRRTDHAADDGAGLGIAGAGIIADNGARRRAQRAAGDRPLGGGPAGRQAQCENTHCKRFRDHARLPVAPGTVRPSAGASRAGGDAILPAIA